MDGYAGVRGAVEGGGTGCQQASTGAGHGLIRKCECHSGRRGEHGDGCGRERKKRDTVGGAKRAGGVAGPVCTFMVTVTVARPTALRVSQPMPWRARPGSVEEESSLDRC